MSCGKKHLTLSEKKFQELYAIFFPLITSKKSKQLKRLGTSKLASSHRQVPRVSDVEMTLEMKQSCDRGEEETHRIFGSKS